MAQDRRKNMFNCLCESDSETSEDSTAVAPDAISRESCSPIDTRTADNQKRCPPLGPLNLLPALRVFLSTKMENSRSLARENSERRRIQRKMRANLTGDGDKKGWEWRDPPSPIIWNAKEVQSFAEDCRSAVQCAQPPQQPLLSTCHPPCSGLQTPFALHPYAPLHSPMAVPVLPPRRLDPLSDVRRAPGYSSCGDAIGTPVEVCSVYHFEHIFIATDSTPRDITVFVQRKKQPSQRH